MVKIKKDMKRMQGRKSLSENMGKPIELKLNMSFINLNKSNYGFEYPIIALNNPISLPSQGFNKT